MQKIFKLAYFKFHRQRRHGASTTLISQAQVTTNTDARSVQTSAASYWQELLSSRAITVLVTLSMNKPPNVRITFNTKERSRYHCCRRKSKGITYSQYVLVSLGIQHAKRMLRIVLSPEACLTLTNFSTLFHNRYSLREKVIDYKMCVLIFSTSSV